jgi:two-component system nitrogen regulation sensor histidine kinase NtrY
VPVFTAIEQMEQDLTKSEARLEEETARTARIVAWGEMARQVAHEIKNPLTPMRLGLQHLKRLGADDDPNLNEKVADTAERLLGEIDRLDRIARSFARYGAPPQHQAGPLEVIDSGEVVREVAQLFELGGGAMGVSVFGDGAAVSCRREELVQVLLNLLDNARQAGASRAVCRLDGQILVVGDDGPGIPDDQLERVFEPTFSTNTSGTGLGLAIVRRLVEGWGGEVHARRGTERGAEIVIEFAPSVTGNRRKFPESSE